MIANYIASLANGGLRAAPSLANGGLRAPPSLANGGLRAPPSYANGGYYADSNRRYRYGYNQYDQGRPNYDYRPTPQYYPQQKPGFGFLRGSPDRPMGTGEPMRPGKFESLMNAAIEGRQDTRITLGDSLMPTTEEERKMFKQVMFNILERDALQRDGRGIDIQTQRALFIPGIMPDGENPMPRNERGTHITHFSDNFGSPRLAEIVDKNYDLLRDAYAHEYQQYQEATARQGAPRQQQSGGIARFFGF